VAVSVQVGSDPAPVQLIDAFRQWVVHGWDRQRFTSTGAAKNTGCAISPMCVAIRFVCWMGLHGMDGTQSARAGEQERLLQTQRLEAIGRMAGGVAHDFNNLLSAILGYAGLLETGLGAEHPLLVDVQGVQHAADKAATLVRQLLAFSRRQVLQAEILDLNAVVSEMHRMLRRIIGEDIELVTVLEAAPATVRADPMQLEQVVMNLAVNASDAMPDGGRLGVATEDVEVDALQARALGLAGPGRYVALTVADTGIGMDAETRASVFEPFFTTKAPGLGTGLGLATVYEIVLQSGGSIRVDSAPGHGSRFRILLPHVDGEPTGACEPASKEQRALPFASETVLLVEDQEMLRSLARRVLESRGYTVLDSGYGDEALRLAQAHAGPIHLLLTDVVMPNMSGPELARRFTPLRPEARVLYVSGYSADERTLEQVGEGSGSFLAKPFTPHSLAAKVREVLDYP
jgi:two-component system cell cycle sensor histidine kinase/response regulator CckA